MALAIVDVAVAQSNGYAKIQKLDSVLAARYYRQDSFDTAYIMRPATIDDNKNFVSDFKPNTLSVI